MAEEFKLVHTQTGEVMPHEGKLLHHLVRTGAKVNEKLVTLGTKLKHGDEVNHQGNTYLVTKNEPILSSEPRVRIPTPAQALPARDTQPPTLQPAINSLRENALASLQRLAAAKTREANELQPHSDRFQRIGTTPVPSDPPAFAAGIPTVPSPAIAAHNEPNLMAASSSVQLDTAQRSGLLQIKPITYASEILFRKISGTGPAQIEIPQEKYDKRTKVLGPVHALKREDTAALYLRWHPDDNLELMEKTCLHHLENHLSSVRVNPYIVSFEPGAWKGDLFKFLNVAMHADSGYIQKDDQGIVTVEQVHGRLGRLPFTLEKDGETYQLNALARGIKVSHVDKNEHNYELRIGERMTLKSGHIIKVLGSQFLFTEPQKSNFLPIKIPGFTAHAKIKNLLAKVNELYPNYYDPIDMNDSRAHADAVKELASALAPQIKDINAPDSHGNTVIHYLTNHGSFDPLLSTGDINWNTKNKKGQTAFQTVFQRSFRNLPQLVSEMKKAGATKQFVIDTAAALAKGGNWTTALPHNLDSHLVSEVHSNIATLHHDIGNIGGKLYENRVDLIRFNLKKVMGEMYDDKYEQNQQTVTPRTGRAKRILGRVAGSLLAASLSLRDSTPIYTPETSAQSKPVAVALPSASVVANLPDVRVENNYEHKRRISLIGNGPNRMFTLSEYANLVKLVKKQGYDEKQLNTLIKAAVAQNVYYFNTEKNDDKIDVSFDIQNPTTRDPSKNLELGNHDILIEGANEKEVDATREKLRKIYRDIAVSLTKPRALKELAQRMPDMKDYPFNALYTQESFGTQATPVKQTWMETLAASNALDDVLANATLISPDLISSSPDTQRYIKKEAVKMAVEMTKQLNKELKLPPGQYILVTLGPNSAFRYEMKSTNGAVKQIQLTPEVAAQLKEKIRLFHQQAGNLIP